MRQKNLYLLCGIPGSGKTTWAKNRIEKYDGIHISRDEVRFSMVKTDEEYFSKEDEVFVEFIRRIQYAIFDKDGPKDIYIVATHINRRSREKVLGRLNISHCKLYIVFFETSLETAIKRNEMREGRSVVPRGVIRRMYFQMDKENSEHYPHVNWYINEDGTIQ